LITGSAYKPPNQCGKYSQQDLTCAITLSEKYISACRIHYNLKNKLALAVINKKITMTITAIALSKNDRATTQTMEWKQQVTQLPE
jgi:hypothetical protein